MDDLALQESLATAQARVRQLEAEYQHLVAELDPLIVELSISADSLAVEFKRLVREAAEAYASGQKELASALASERRARQAECEGLNAQANAHRQTLASKLGELRRQREVERGLRRELVTRRQPRRVAPKPSREWGWFSKFKSESQKTEILVGPDGQPTAEYPHVHVIHDETKGFIKIIASRGPTDHPFQRLLDGDALASEVDSVIAEMIAKL